VKATANITTRKNETYRKSVMNKILSLALLVGGVVLIIFGIQATNSFSSDVSRFFTGSPTDKAVWMLIGGVVAAVVGLLGLSLTRRSSGQG
jgi:drug/metabolite transporter (DMT)-like permease